MNVSSKAELSENNRNEVIDDDFRNGDIKILITTVIIVSVEFFGGLYQTDFEINLLFC